MKGPHLSLVVRVLFNIWAVPSSTLAEHWIVLTVRLWLVVLSSLLTCWEETTARIFELGSKLLSIPPCGVYSARESAVVIIGGADSECTEHITLQGDIQ